MNAMGRCLVTGSAGFIGFHLTKGLFERGEEVVGVFKGHPPQTFALQGVWEE